VFVGLLKHDAKRTGSRLRLLQGHQFDVINFRFWPARNVVSAHLRHRITQSDPAPATDSNPFSPTPARPRISPAGNAESAPDTAESSQTPKPSVIGEQPQL
jgi:hypothetical protein